jgi:hypothetical protein
MMYLKRLSKVSLTRMDHSPIQGNHNYDSPGLVSDLMKCHLWLSLLYLGLTSLYPVVSIKLLHLGGG